MTDSAILERVRKLLRLAESSNEHEAASAAAKAQDLIDANRLNVALLAMDDMTAAPAPDEPITDYEAIGAPLDPRTRQPMYVWALALSVAKANHCGVYRSGGRMQIYGRPSDVETVRYFYAMLITDVERLIRSRGNGAGRVWRNNYGRGIVETISKKLKDQHDETIREARTVASFQAAPGQEATALMRVNTALATIEARADATHAFGHDVLKLRSGSGRSSTYDAGARELGRRDGQAVNIGRASGRLVSGARALPGRRS